jgi:hypothetical protein
MLARPKCVLCAEDHTPERNVSGHGDAQFVTITCYAALTDRRDLREHPRSEERLNLATVA